MTKIKDIINENHIKWLYESGKIVDGIDNTVSQVLNYIRTAWRNRTYHKNGFIDNNNKKIPIPYYCSIIKQCNIVFEKQENILDIVLEIYNPRNDIQKDYLINNNYISCKFLYGNNGIHQLLIAGMLKNEKFSLNDISDSITHELTHFYQTINNSKLKTDKDINNYNKQYYNITNQYFKQSGELKKFSYICNYFTKSELSAKVNGLYEELVKQNITKENYLNLYKNTNFYEYYEDILKVFEVLKNLNSNYWEQFRNLAQQYGFYKETMTLNTAPNAEIFKKQFVNFINRMIGYFNKNIDVVLNKLINN